MDINKDVLLQAEDDESDYDDIAPDAGDDDLDTDKEDDGVDFGEEE
jgi:hypothetical protein